MKLEIIDMIDDGRCVAKYEGKTVFVDGGSVGEIICLLYTSPSPRDLSTSRMPSSA